MSDVIALVSVIAFSQETHILLCPHLPPYLPPHRLHLFHLIRL